MGRIEIKEMCKEFVERRGAPRVINSDPDLHKGGHLLVLDRISLNFDDGELVCLLGPSGCGKTTLVRIIAGFETPSAGSVLIDEKPVAGPSSDNIFVFQHNGLLPWMTVWENVRLGLRHMRDRKEMATRIREYLDVVNLTGFEAHYPHHLSGGMQRRAELARALVVNPEVLFMDEPFAGLDFLTRLKMREEIINMHEFIHKTILFITHDIEEALEMADRVVVFSDRPAQVRMNLKLDFPHPRDFTKDTALEDIRRSVYTELGVHYAL
ncbi:MAG: ABC transporter ATP-binding protein [Desulfomonile tiedjei]|uniref:ABC transporter ATP-binding protein n=1 Tax=Desulfomonile tiedjei TaxID=2358 RepID=A0A9D6V0K9_9BACT|nr:ABC transporter ATP-binding protein [Desulfomonile tiedjei]